MKTLKQIHLLAVILLGLLTVANGQRSVDLTWDAQEDATSFKVLVDGVVKATVSGNQAAGVTIPSVRTTITLVATNIGGDSLPSEPLTIPAAPANPKGIAIKKITRITVSTP